MVDVAAEVGADAVAHGCTGKGNDQASTWNVLLMRHIGKTQKMILTLLFVLID